MNRIFASLAVVSTLVLFVAMGFGLWIEDPASRDAAEQAMVQRHLLLAMGGLILAFMVHGLVLTYFMGTGRWIEETTKSYSLDEKCRRENIGLKYRTLPMMVGTITLLIIAGAFGAAADPATPVGFQGWLGIPASTWHFLMATTAIGLHLVTIILEYYAITRNGELIRKVMEDVQRIRKEHGLTDEANHPAAV